MSVPSSADSPFGPPAVVTGSGGAVPSGQWLAVYVRMHHERKVADLLQDKGIESFLPVQEELRRWSDRLKRIRRVLIPMLVFVRATPLQRLAVLRTPSVIRFLTDPVTHATAIISDAEMQRFQFLVGRADVPISIVAQSLSPGERVIIIKGPLRGLEAEVHRQEGHRHVFLRIGAIGCASIALPPDYLERM